MAVFPDEWMARLRGNNDIVDVVSQYVALKPNSGRHWGLCPFHSEKTPSFNVNGDKQFFYCFGCHKGGDVVRFVMDIEKLSFPEGVEFLARRANMQLPETIDDEQAAKQRLKKQRVLAANKAAARFFYGNLVAEGGRGARAYLQGRGIDEATVKHFGLGYARDSWDALVGHLRGEGFSDQEAVDANLAAFGKSGAYDFFRNRLMFPIINQYGDVVGFGGRVLDGSMPKYINTSDTAAFNKRRNLYGLNYLSKQGASFMLMVEGYMDVVSLYQRGGVHAVATLGTALTPEQARLMKRYAAGVCVAYDGDSAGQRATLRGLDILREEGLEVKVVLFPAGMDPDEFISREGKQAFEQAVDSAVPLMEYKLLSLQKGFDMKDAEQRMKYAIAAAGLLRTLADPVEKERYLLLLRKQTGFTMEALQAQAGIAVDAENKKNRIGKLRDNKPRRELPQAHVKAERHILSTMAKGPEALEQVLGQDLCFAQEDNRRLAEIIVGFRGKQFSYADVLAALDGDNASFAAEVFERFPECGDQRFFEDCVGQVKLFSLEEEIGKLQALAKEQTQQEEINRIISKIQQLNIEYMQLRKTLIG
ncbi:MAG: DNA primase [Christensenellales bacterium]|jgi:DNA primase